MPDPTAQNPPTDPPSPPRSRRFMCKRCGRTGGELTENGCPAHGSAAVGMHDDPGGEQNAPAAPPSVAVEPPAAPGAGTDTPEAAEGEFGACCDLHGPNCEPPSELCCEDCAEARHPFHPPDVDCTWANKEDVEFGQAVQRLAGNVPEAQDARGHCLGCRPVNGERSPIDLPCPVHQAPEAHSGAGLVLGSVLIRQREVWWSDGDCYWLDWRRVLPPSGRALLVDPAAGPVLKAALAWGEARDAWTDDPEYTTRANAYLEAERKLAAAVDAATSGQPTAKLAVASRGLADEGMTESSGHAAGPIQPLDLTDAERAEALAVVESRAAYCVQTTDNDLQAFAELPDCEACGGTGKQVPPDFYGPAESAPEPAGDGPGWDRPGIGAAENVLRRGGKAPGLADQLGALVAHFDLRGRMLHRAERERDAARAELAEVTAEQNRLFGLAERAMAERSDATAEVDRWVERHARTVAQLSDVRQNRDDQHAAATRLSYELEQTRAELITERGTGRAIARRDGAADALGWAAKETDRRIYDDGDAVAYKLSRLAAEVRSGEREVPTRQDGDS